MDDTLPVQQPYVGSDLGPLQRTASQSNVTQQGNEAPSQLPDVGQPLIPDLGYFSSGDPAINNVVSKLTEDKPGQPRYQLWPERVARSGLTAAGDALTGKLSDSVIDPNTGEVKPNPEMIARSLDMAALGGAGGLTAAPEEGAASSLGSSPFLRPALKYKDRIYKAPPDAVEHSEAIPKHLQDDFYQKAMSGEDINDYKFGFMNHKGQFLDREAALDYGIKEGLVDPQAGKYGVLTSTMLSDSSKPGMAIEAMKSAEPALPKDYFSKVPEDMRLSRSSTEPSHPGYRWQVSDPKTGKVMRKDIMTRSGANKTRDNLDNKYGSYKYKAQMIKADDLTDNEAQFLKDNDIQIP